MRFIVVVEDEVYELIDHERASSVCELKDKCCPGCTSSTTFKNHCCSARHLLPDRGINGWAWRKINA